MTRLNQDREPIKSDKICADHQESEPEFCTLPIFTKKLTLDIFRLAPLFALLYRLGAIRLRRITPRICRANRIHQSSPQEINFGQSHLSIP